MAKFKGLDYKVELHPQVVKLSVVMFITLLIVVIKLLIIILRFASCVWYILVGLRISSTGDVSILIIRCLRCYMW